MFSRSIIATRQAYAKLHRPLSAVASAAKTLFTPEVKKSAYGASAKHNKNIIWSEELFTPAQRRELVGAGHGGCTVWITGLSGSGKSTIAAKVEKELLEMGLNAYRLDGDNVRFGLCKDLGFSPAAREENIRRVSETAALFADAGMVTITAFISPYKESRALARKIHEDARLTFLEVHAHVDLATAESRDPKGLYKKARAGELSNFTGIDDRFDEPKEPDLKLHTADMSVPACSGAVISEIKARGIISGKFRLNA